MIRFLRIRIADALLALAEHLPAGYFCWLVARYSLIIFPVDAEARKKTVAWWDTVPR